ncbi:MAG: M20/M25/M40 family metallo-hydrolase [Ruminiclostridium sp.]|nr:M20/M25/M40 family metallo-hydrolase [Ruminiclostridium sp.]
MINKERMLNEFLQLVRIDSLSRHERQMADALKEKLSAMGYEPVEDDAGGKIDGNAGNIICNVKGDKKVPAVLLMAHMDTVVPGTGKNPILGDGVIKTDGTTVLGGDDAIGLECILEALRVLKEDNIRHGDIQAAFTVGEEAGLLGAKNMDYGKIYSKYGIVLDAGGPIGNVAVKAPSQNNVKAVIKGRAAHAGMEPEKGISAIQIASEAISHMKLGRIDSETTANIGVIKGGLATNIVCDRVEIAAEARSRTKSKLDAQTAHMKECFEKAAALLGGSVEFAASMEYEAFNVPEDSEIMKILKKAAADAAIELVPAATGGGSDTNVISGKGIQAVDISIGMDKVHSVEERVLVDDMVKAAEFLVSIIRNIA